MRITIEYDGKRVIRNKNGVTKKPSLKYVDEILFFG